MRPKKNFKIDFNQRYGHFKIFALLSTPDSGTAYILMRELLKFWNFI